jgi:hypothetical protein
MDHLLISRIDRAVADNLKDIQWSFGNQAGLVQDFIVFISRQVKTDLFGYTSFTLKGFCEYTGRNRQDLALIHPDFVSGKSQPPVIQGFAFATILDYALYSMMERNILLSNRYEVKHSGSIIQMHNFPILKDLKLNFNRHPKEQKVYDVRLSDELLHGFLTRYYTFSSESYRLVGKGRGGDSRKKLLIYLSKLNHVMVSSSCHNQMIVPVDRLCGFADINDIKPSHKKQNLARMLNYIRDTGKFAFDYSFINNSSPHGYYINLVFNPVFNKRTLQIEHAFYHRLLTTLKSIFESQIKTEFLATEGDPFQFWLCDKYSDIQLKAQALIQSYYIAYNLNISQAYAVNLIQTGDFLTPLTHVK